MIVRAAIGGGLVVATLLAAGLALGDGSGASTPEVDRVLGPGPATVELGIEHSAFSTGRIVVRQGTELTFVVDNGDPIRHELIVGPSEVHARHEAGTEAAHPPRPGEVTIDPLEQATTTYAFDEPGFVEFACHLPGHLAYGMTGTVQVVPA